ncbi:MAG: TetR/AcrR family transcriptional regulator [Steroidobacteraceae bacterium]|nr:TetR/AcrR family transcriptional regulator [Steroidobacteraceae bacterium]MDW8259021.1 TetR/AcrR family transcriptional regulator [Gammaproteobacteria bacterium]
MGRIAGVRNADYEQTRQELIGKVRARLERQDGRMPSFRELALACGVSVATLRHYFIDRQRLLEAVFSHYLKGAGHHLARARQADEQALADSLRAFLQRVVQGWTQGHVGSLHRIGLSEGLRDQTTALHYLQDVLEPTLQALEARLETYRSQHRVRADIDTRHAALALLAPIVLALLHQVDLGGTRCRPLDIRALIELHVAMFVRAFGVKSDPIPANAAAEY